MAQLQQHPDFCLPHFKNLFQLITQTNTITEQRTLIYFDLIRKNLIRFCEMYSPLLIAGRVFAVSQLLHLVR